MENYIKNINKKYDRVMPRINNRSRCSLKSSSTVTRHEIPSSSRIGAKPSVSNMGSSVFSELPVVLNDYVPESSGERSSRRTLVVKPRKTVKSLDPALSPHRNVRVNEPGKRVRNLASQSSAPSVVFREREKWSDTHYDRCLTSRSHSKLKELKDEIKAYHNTDKLMRLRSHLYKSCGVVLDDVGRVAADKAVQVQDMESDRGHADKRSEQRDDGEDARTALSDKQMRTGPRYPVDRYLVESSKNIEMVNIIDENLWDPEPALRPEDEIILRKLHEMLQSTADDLKLLSGELSKFHEPGVQIKTAPTPLDEEFNEKVHIEELVNAKFHGHKIVDKSHYAVEPGILRGVINKPKPVTTQRTRMNNTGVQVNVTPMQTKLINRNLGVSRTKIIQISDKRQNNKNNEKLNNCKVINNAPAVAYNEFYYKYIEPKDKENSRKVLQVQEMPSINIRSELKEQKVLNIDILPECTVDKENNSSRNNVTVVSIQHEMEPKQVPVISNEPVQYKQTKYNKPVRKVQIMSTCCSSDSTNNISSDAPIVLQTPKFNQYSPKTQKLVDSKSKSAGSKKESKKQTHLNLEEWKKKLNKVYGPSSSRKSVTAKSTKNKRTHSDKITLNPSKLNNAEYIPYSHLTLGGVRVSDIEKEISEIPNKNDIPLSPILDRILSSRENSPRTYKQKESPRVLTTSDENLLQEVLDIEKTISETISKNHSKKCDGAPKLQESTEESGCEENESYLDDFEDDKSEHNPKSDNENNKKDSQSEDSEKSELQKSSDSAVDDDDQKPGTSKVQNTTFTKTTNLSFKKSVDIFEFIHSVDRQDTGTQSSTASRILPKETQTSPRNDNTSIQPIHNDLWPSIDPSGEVQHMFKLEKELIKKLIVDEYGDLLEKNFTKPSTSKDMTESDKNVAAYQKNTQTSPARMKSVMTSPKRTKTRTTSPFSACVADNQTSPIIHETEDIGVNVNIDNEECDISINLSSPRFSLRLPQTSRDVLSRLGSCSKTPSKIAPKSKTVAKSSTQSSTSIDADNSSSEISSLGEIKLKLNRWHVPKRVPTISESSFTSTISLYSSDAFSGDILPLRSVGELSGEPAIKGPRSEGEEISFDLLK